MYGIFTSIQMVWGQLIGKSHGSPMGRVWDLERHRDTSFSSTTPLRSLGESPEPREATGRATGMTPTLSSGNTARSQHFNEWVEGKHLQESNSFGDENQGFLQMFP